MEIPVEPTLPGPRNAESESESLTPMDTPASSEVDSSEIYQDQSFLTEGAHRISLPYCFILYQSFSNHSPYGIPSYCFLITVYSKSDLAHIDLIEKKFLKEFPVDYSKKYSSGAALHDAMQMFGSEYGISVSRRGHKIECTRADRVRAEPKALPPGSKPRKKRNRETQRCGCLFSCNFAGETKANPEVHITKVSYRHSDSCIPSVTQLMNAKRKNGAYLSLINSELSCLNLCIQMAKDRQYIEPNMLRTALRSIPGFPAAVGISSSTLYNCRLRILKIANESRDSSLLQCDLGQSAEALIAEGNGTPLDGKWESVLLRIQNIVTIVIRLLYYSSFPTSEITPDYVDMAYEIVRKHLIEVWNSTEEGSCDSSRMIMVLKAAAAEDKGFTYRVGRDAQGKITAFVWQNANMRRQLELNGGYLSLDAMKRQIVSCNWPYIGIALLDPDCNLFVGLEGICASERNEAYTFVLQSALAMTPKLKPSDIKIIAADGLLSEHALTAAGIPPTCVMILDVYHLLHQDWPNYFTTPVWKQVKGLFNNLVYADKEIEHKKAVALIRARFKDEATRLQYVETRVFPLAAKFARCYVKLYLGMYLTVALTYAPAASIHATHIISCSSIIFR
jgi:hypothetical protein